MREHTKSLFDFAAGSVKRSEPAPVAPRLATARLIDPAPSHLAAKEMNESGAAERQVARIEAVLQIQDDRLHARTPGEIAEYLNKAEQTHYFDSVKVLKRLADLRKLGLAMSFGDRKCSVNKRAAGVWVHAWSCCAKRENHVFGRLPKTDLETIQCRDCGKGLGVRRVTP